MTRSLILAAHGNTADGNRNRSMFELADGIVKRSRFSERNRFDHVVPAFLRCEPYLVKILKDVPSGEVVVVPALTSSGFFLSLLRTQLRNDPSIDTSQCFITNVLGSHESIPRRVSQRLALHFDQYQLKFSQTTVVVIGHGTWRHANSTKTTFALSKQLQMRHSGLTIKTAFLDQSPSLESVIRTIQTPNIVVIPFLIGRGPHATKDIPAAFGLPTGDSIEFPIIERRLTNSNNGYVICDLPVGLYPEMADVCLELAAGPLERLVLTSASGNRPVNIPIGESCR